MNLNKFADLKLFNVVQFLRDSGNTFQKIAADSLKDLLKYCVRALATHRELLVLSIVGLVLT